jgi:molybdopterin synthase sulfur carrier subunit
MRQIELDTGSKVKDLIILLCESESQKTELIESDNLKQHIMIMINGHHLMSLNGFDTLLEDNDTVVIFPLLGGG